MMRASPGGTGRNVWTGIGLSLFLSAMLLAMGIAPAAAAPKAEPWSFWAANDPGSRTSIDHAPWDRFLKKYVVTNHLSGINRVRYASVTPDDRKSLDAYVLHLQHVEVTRLNRSGQKAYWINLYNALTQKVVLDHSPVKSIRDIKISPGLFSSGPWGAKLLSIQGQKVSLDDIEHRILRPLWKDNRVHYAVNCASLGCPNLQPDAYTPENTEALLEKGAREYVNHPRGVRLSGGRLHRKVKETIALLVSKDNGCDYCVASHSAALRSIGTSPEEIARIMEDLAESDFSAKERGLIGFARRANLAPSDIPEEEFQALKEFGATEAEIVEALGVMELFVGFNRFLDSLHVDIDFPRRGA